MNIGNIHNNMSDHEKALDYLFRSLEILEELQDQSGISTCLLSIGNTYVHMEAYPEALENLQKALELKVELGERYRESACLDNLGNLYAKWGDYKLALDYYRQSLDIKEEISDRIGICSLYYLMGNVYLNTGRYKQAKHYSDLSLVLAQELELLDEQVRIHKQLSVIYSATRNYRDAYMSQLTHKELYDSLFNRENIRRITGLEYEYNHEKEKQALELEQQRKDALSEAEARRQKILRNSLLGGMGTITIIVFLILYAYIQKRRDNKRIREKNTLISDANEELKQLNEEITVQKEEIESQRDHLYNQNEAITASINYAQRIQSALLPPEMYINELLGEVFILYKPREIVSGDFYWIKQVNQYLIVVAADCTGHGVPGAFMSMLGMSFLTEIVQRREITQANQVLNEMRHQIKHSLRQHGHPDETKDGIDMALCIIDEKTRMMQYAGANNPLYIIKESNGKPELNEIKADRMPLGYYSGKDRPFTNHEISLGIGDTFYLFSDGFVDQKGGVENKKFMSKNFKVLLLEIHDQPMYEQKEILDKALTEWMGNNAQTDDILVVGVRV